MTIQTSVHAAALVDAIRGRVRGRVITADDADYDGARVVLPGDVDGHPGVIVRPTDAGDVASVVDIARDSGIELAVRSGGHSAAGHGTTNGGLVLDVRDLDTIDIDIARRSAWAGSGVTASRYTTALGEHGVVTGFGDTGSVGLGGITLGGGVGFLSRKYGLTIDSLLGAEIVTADGTVRRIDADNEPDLFWAIRGGGGNFGVATRFEYRLHELPSVVGGMLFLPATVDTIAGFMELSLEAPDELTTIANIMPAPPMPFLDQEHHGKVILFAFMTYAGDTEAGQRAIAPFRALAKPFADMVRPMKYAEMYMPEDTSYHPLAVARNMFIDRFDRDVARLILDRLAASDASMRAAQLRPHGGAIARVPVDATAFAHRKQRIMVNIASFYDGPDDRQRRLDWVTEFVSALNQGDPAVYVNFLADEGPERVRAAYPGNTWDRLTRIKAQYDPTNLFHRNQNIPPAT
jgi:FAD/FMN-containing dehydrogenase